MKKYKLLSIIYFLVVGLIIFNVENLEIISTALEYVSCGDSKGIPKTMPMLTSWAFTILLIGVPIVLIIFSIITLAKSTVAGNSCGSNKIYKEINIV